MVGTYAKLVPRMVSLTIYVLSLFALNNTLAVLVPILYGLLKMGICFAGFGVLCGFNLNPIILLLELHILLPSF